MRRHGEGNLWIERRKGRPVRYVVDHVHKGVRQRQRFDTMDEAKAALRRTDPSVRLTGSTPLSDCLRAWIASARARLAPSTHRRYREIVDLHLIPALGKTRLDRLTVGDVEGYLWSHRQHPQTVYHHRALLRKVLNDEIRDGRLTRNVAALAKPPSVPRTERKWLSGEQLKTLFDGTEDSDYHALWVLAGTSGLRSGELLALSWDDIDPPYLRVVHTLHRIEGEWQFRKPKNPTSARIVPLDGRGVRALKAHRIRQANESQAEGWGTKHGLVFTTPRGEPLHEADLAKHLKRDLLAAGLPVVTLHALRHSCASWLLATGADIKTISRMLGHSTPAITQELYLHVGTDLIRHAVTRAEEAMG